MFQSKQQSLHRIAVGIVAFSISAFTLVGCDDRDVAIGLGGAAIGAGAAIIIGGGRGGSYDHDGYRTVCSDYYDYYGRYYRDCRRVGGGIRPYGNETESGIFDSENASAMTVENFASEFHLSFESAKVLVNSFEMAKNGDNAGFIALGFNTADLREMAQFNLPSEETIALVSKNLNVSPGTTTGMLNRMRAWAMTEQTKKCDEVRYSDDADAKAFFENYCN